MSKTSVILMSVIPLAFLITGLMLTVLSDKYISRLQKRLILIILALTASLIAQNVLDFVFDLRDYTENLILIRKIVSIYGYSVRPVILVLIFYLVDPNKKKWPLWILAAVNAGVHLTALFSKIVFSFDKHNWFNRGPLGYTSHVISAMLIICLLIVIIISNIHEIRKMLFQIGCVLLMITGAIIDTVLKTDEQGPVVAVTISAIITCIFYYFWLHARLVRQYESNILAEQRIKIMVSQIQPHFLYNTIATFRALCKKDPEKAAEVAEKFGQYLRINLDSLNSENLIPFEREIEHTRIYSDIEMVRFENVRVEYDISDKDFYLPALTVQPMVENAIRHGVRIREEGIVRVISRLNGEFHEIVIQDNGIGFDELKAKNAEGTHIGISNVRERIEKLCGGTLTIESVLDTGTTVTIRIPIKEAGI